MHTYIVLIYIYTEGERATEHELIATWMAFHVVLKPDCFLDSVGSTSLLAHAVRNVIEFSVRAETIFESALELEQCAMPWPGAMQGADYVAR